MWGYHLDFMALIAGGLSLTRFSNNTKIPLNPSD